MEPTRPIDEEAVASLARAAGLPLPSERVSLLTPQLREWLEAANELNRTMADPRHLEVTPITVFTHPANLEPTE
jgi:hypothetical protein